MITLSPNSPEIVLASQSPRRRELLEEIGLPFEVHPSAQSEESEEKNPEKLVQLLALRKAKFVSEKLASEESRNKLIIGSDTVVVSGEEILGKPSDKDDARRMITLLSGKTHSVWGGVALICLERNIEVTYSTVTEVTFRSLSKEAIESYLTIDEYRDKAGAYAIQGKAQMFLEKINGSYTNVVGIDTAELVKELLTLKIVEWG